MNPLGEGYEKPYLTEPWRTKLCKITKNCWFLQRCELKNIKNICPDQKYILFLHRFSRKVSRAERAGEQLFEEKFLFNI